MAEFVTLQENPKIKEYQEKLHGLRSDGVNKITEEYENTEATRSLIDTIKKKINPN
mgnify:CR=1 FL=1